MMKFARWLYLVAGIYGLFVLLPQYFLESRNGLNFPPAIILGLHPNTLRSRLQKLGIKKLTMSAREP
ncbi:MAG: hypothetical protein ACREEM_36650 [Blastocatellia bacterium]